MMTTSESSTIKNSSSLSSSDLVSRFLAATPPYLYNAPPMQHNFFFSEMLRSFVQAKNESASPSTSNGIRRRKRSWKESRDRPLELTTKEKNRNQRHAASHTTTSQYQPHYHQVQPSQAQQQQILLQHHQNLQEHQTQTPFIEMKSRKDNHRTDDSQDVVCKISKQEVGNIKTIDENDFLLKNEQAKKYFTDKIALSSPNEALFSPDVEKLKVDESQHMENRNSYIDNNFLQYCARSPVDNFYPSELKNKFDVTPKNFFPNIVGRSDDFQPLSNFSIPSRTTSDFLPSPLWYPPYPLTTTYPAIDPLHFFIDLRVSGHIWDRKSNEKYIFNRNKNNSAFSVPQSKEYNRPLNLTRSESTITRYGNENFKGTHHIFKNIRQTYKKIRNSENLSRIDTTNEDFDDTTKSPKTQITSHKKDEICDSPLSKGNERQLNKGYVGLDLIVNN